MAGLRGAPAAALAAVTERALAGQANVRARTAGWVARAGASAQLPEAIRQWLTGHARLTLNFHPDRIAADGCTVAEGLVRAGRFRNQFETGLTSGSPTAYPGGARDTWERSLFGAPYAGPITAGERPKYGALDPWHHADGGSPRFGSCYAVLAPHVLARCSFTWGDSHLGPPHVGTLAALDAIVLALCEAAATSGAVLGREADLAGLHAAARAARDGAPGVQPIGRALDDYIEAQIHGELPLADDVAALVLDPSFVGTPDGDRLIGLAAHLGIACTYHAGFVLAPAAVPLDFRGPRMGPLAERVAGFSVARDRIDAAAIGRAARSLHEDPAGWQDWETPSAAWQALKQLWHVLVAFGVPALPAAAE